MASVQYLYHYTSTAGANGIRNDGLIRSQSGIILSTLKPEDHSRDDILQNIYGRRIPSNARNKADNVVLVKMSILDTSKLNSITATLYRYSAEIRVSANDVIDKPRCVSGGSGSGWGGSPQNSQWLYYYTNKVNATSIMRTGSIPYQSTIYLVSMEPERHYRNEILDAIYGKRYDRTQHATCADWCIKVDRSKLDVNKLQKNGTVYEYGASISINPAHVMDKPQCNKHGSNNAWGGTDEYLYHYTNTTGAQAIKAAGYLKMSGSSGAFGVGVYMTNLRPNDFFRDDILKNNYGGINSAFKGRADWVVRVKRSNLVQSKLKSVGSNVTRDGSRQIFVYQDTIVVQSSDVFDKPKCYRAK
ncbi:uncharacterized protein LOC119083275 [Bradysia coprophila]|uniref:uncharacterized protein LOC119083275 n=1 Tax=Bradysia coprophila TaxID=38358 RepID=UPI00187DA299|nr:uncharacterized protein LOC119083275 [Bradysia coprophila]